MATSIAVHPFGEPTWRRSTQARSSGSTKTFKHFLACASMLRLTVTPGASLACTPTSTANFFRASRWKTTCWQLPQRPIAARCGRATRSITCTGRPCPVSSIFGAYDFALHRPPFAQGVAAVMRVSLVSVAPRGRGNESPDQQLQWRKHGPRRPSRTKVSSRSFSFLSRSAACARA